VFRKTILILSLLIANALAYGQTLTYTFIDPCTKDVTYFSVPATGTVIFFLNQSRSFTSADISNGTFGTWVNQAYTDYRKVSPCGVQQGQVTQNQITSQIIGGTVQSIVSSIVSSAQSTAGGTDAAGKGKTESDKKKKDNQNGNNNNNNTSNSSDNTSSTSSGTGSSTTSSGSTSTGQGSGGSTSSGSTNGGSGNNNNGGTGGGGNGGSTTTNNQPTQTSTTTSSSNNNQNSNGEEIAATTTMNIDAHNNDGGGSSGGSKGGAKNSAARGNPIIVSSDITNAQNLDKTFTPIVNIGMSQASLTGMRSWGITSMVWLNFQQFALSGKYTLIHFSKKGKLKWVHNLNLTGVYSYGNILGFVGYSGILNAGKYGVTGINVSMAGTIVNEEQNTFFSPSVTAFYTKPFIASKRLTVSPEMYLISTPLIYSSKDKVTVTSRTFSGFLGSGFDYQITKRFKINLNYKANLSSDPSFPILSFFMIGSKVNL